MKRLLIVGLLLCASVSAEISIVDSIEWMAVDTPLIVVGTVAHCATTKSRPGTYVTITVQIDEALKGEPGGETVTFRMSNPYRDETCATWQEDGHPRLFFLRKGIPNDGGNIDGHWTPRDWRHAIIDLNKPEHVCSEDMTLLTNADEILKVVRQWRAWQPPELAEVAEHSIHQPQEGYLRLEPPGDSPVYRDIWADSTCYINVPAAEKYRPMVMKMLRSGQTSQIAAGANMLRNYPGDDTVDVLTQLLRNPRMSAWSKGAGLLDRYSYDVRKAAYDSLLALGATPEKPVLERAPGESEAREFRRRHWHQTMRDILPRGWTVEVQEIAQPPGWERLAGGDGITITCFPGWVLFADVIGDVAVPAFNLYVMPLDWEGRGGGGAGALIGGKHAAHMGVITDLTVRPARYLGRCSRGHFFGSPGADGHEGWDDPYGDVIRHFKLEITSAYDAR